MILHDVSIKNNLYYLTNKFSNSTNTKSLSSNFSSSDLHIHLHNINSEDVDEINLGDVVLNYIREAYGSFDGNQLSVEDQQKLNSILED